MLREVNFVRRMTEGNLRDAFAGESQAHMKYQIFADVAEKRGLSNLARLFRAISYAELVHARNHLKALGEVRGNVDNIQSAIDGETYEVEEMYPAFMAVAELQKEKPATRSFNYAFEAEKIHAVMYRGAKKTVESGGDISLGDVFICDVCGHTVEGEAPDYCPICGAKKDKFKKF
jgi:rubrerythrin